VPRQEAYKLGFSKDGLTARAARRFLRNLMAPVAIPTWLRRELALMLVCSVHDLLIMYFGGPGFETLLLSKD